MLKLREMRKTRSDLTMKELGALIGVSESAVGYYETGKRQPSLEMLSKIADALGCKVRDLIDEGEEDAYYSEDDDEDALLEETNFLYKSPDVLDLVRACMDLSGEQIQLLALVAKEMEPKGKRPSKKHHAGLIVSEDV